MRRRRRLGRPAAAERQRRAVCAPERSLLRLRRTLRQAAARMEVAAGGGRQVERPRLIRLVQTIRSPRRGKARTSHLRPPAHRGCVERVATLAAVLRRETFDSRRIALERLSQRRWMREASSSRLARLMPPLRAAAARLLRRGRRRDRERRSPPRTSTTSSVWGSPSRRRPTRLRLPVAGCRRHWTC